MLAAFIKVAMSNKEKFSRTRNYREPHANIRCEWKAEMMEG